MREQDRRRFIELLKNGFKSEGAILGSSAEDIKRNLRDIWDAHLNVSIEEFVNLIPEIAQKYKPRGEIRCCSNTQSLVNKYGDGREIKRIIE